MDITEIRNKWSNGDYSYSPDIPKKIRDNYIFNEDFSVKHNRELVKEHNDRVDMLQKEADRIQRVLYEKLTSDIVEYIRDNYSLTEEQARKVESFVYQEHHSFMYDYFCYIDTFAGFAHDLVNSEKSS